MTEPARRPHWLARQRLTRRDTRAAEKWLMRMFDRPEDHAQGLADWIERKPARRALYLDMLQGMEAPSRAAAIVALSKVRGRQPGPLHMIWSASPALVSLGAVMAAGALATLVLDLRDETLPGLIGPARAMTMTTRIGEVRTETLPDGSEIVLDTDTRIQVAYSATERIITLEQGRIRVTAAPEPARAMVVRVTGLSVKPTGRIFDVSQTAPITIAAIEGGLDVVPPGTSQRSIPVKSGETLSFKSEDAPPPTPRTTRPSDTQWVNGVKNFENASVGEIIAEANRYSVTQLELGDAALGQRRIFGDIDIRDIDRVAEAIAGYLDLHIDRSKPRRLLLVRKQ